MVTEQEYRESRHTAREVLAAVKDKEQMITRRPEPIRSDDGRVIGYRMVKVDKPTNNHIINIEMKKCKKCGQEKTLIEFGRDKRRSDGLNQKCKECVNAKFRAAYTTKRDRPLEYPTNCVNIICGDDQNDTAPTSSCKAVCKMDEGKLRHDLVPANWHVALAEVMTHGITKYEPNTWQQIESDQIVAALMRHFCAWRNGEIADQDSQLNHLKHVMANAAILLSITQKLNEQ